jgi:hypothetical protein
MIEMSVLYVFRLLRKYNDCDVAVLGVENDPWIFKL